MNNKKNIYILWAVSCSILIGVILYFLIGAEDKSFFLIGDTTSGHYQIELKCESCHTKAFSDQEDIQTACTSCHATELSASDDSHPKSKFTDPRNAEYIDILDARYCVSCHTEHQENRTLAMGLTVPADYCFHCHKDIADDRPSHADFAFDSCSSAGCHNFHDNRGLYEDFMAKHLDEPKIKAPAKLFERDVMQAYLLLNNASTKTIKPHSAIYPNNLSISSDLLDAALVSSHAKGGVDCGGCHQSENVANEGWLDKPSEEQCSVCHESQTKGFLSGKHGMRLNAGLGAMSPELARSVMKAESGKEHLSCNSCHAAHEYNVREAAVTECLGCHDDEHSQAYLESPHYQLWVNAGKGLSEEVEGVSCASCHLPRERHKYLEKSYIAVQHNQNANLRPNEKMIRSVCMHCHGLEFSIDALADPELILNNFSTAPNKHIESLDMIKKRQQ